MYTTRGAILRSELGKLDVVELGLDAPRVGELTVKMTASGLCHSDDHLVVGDIPASHYPICMGHEGAGEVIEVGPDTPGWSEGDHVVFSFLPVCGRCRWCAEGKQSLCDLGATLQHGSRFDDTSSFRMTHEGVSVGQHCGISTLSEMTTVSVLSTVKVPKHLPLDKLCLLGCGVGTGWGSAVNTAALEIGHTVIIVGIGGIGSSALQGAAHAGASHIIAVDVLAGKEAKAREFGATHFYTSFDEAAEFARSVTNGQGPDAVIITVGVIGATVVEKAVAAVRKAGTVVLTAAGSYLPTKLELSLLDITMSQKRIQGTLFGGASPFVSIPKLARLYDEGALKLDEMITARYSLDDVNTGYADMKAGRNIRGIVEFN